MKCLPFLRIFLFAILYCVGAAKLSQTELKEYQVDLDYEIHQGVLTDSGKYVKFSNIPYTSPPLGDLRWTFPFGIEDNNGVVNNGSKSAVCPQFDPGWIPAATDFNRNILLHPALDDKWKAPIGPGNYEGIKPKPKLHPDSNEDCLLLDVTVPKEIWEKRHKRESYKPAVLVWIHGGDFTSGSKDQSGSPEGLLDTSRDETEQSVIFVSINYRLGVFGWLGGEKAVDDGVVPNVGLKDQQVAFEWVRDYIHAFGGDSRRVTVMGHGASIMHHLMMPSPYFRSAIVQSPAFIPSPNQARLDQTYNQLLTLMGAKNLDELLEANTTDLMQANADMIFNSSYGTFSFGPTVDGYFVRQLPGKALNEDGWRVPVMVGHAKYDSLFYTPPWIRNNSQLREHVLTLFSGAPDTVLDEISARYPIDGTYLAKDKLLKVASFLNDITVQCNTYYITEANRKSTSTIYHPVYRYMFNTVPAGHEADVPYTFYPSIDTKPAVNKDLAKLWQKAIVDFTRYTDPNPEDSEYWPQYTSEKRKVMDFGSPGQWLTPNFDRTVGDDVIDKETCEYWRNAPYYALSSPGKDGYWNFDHNEQERMEM